MVSSNKLWLLNNKDNNEQMLCYFLLADKRLFNTQHRKYLATFFSILLWSLLCSFIILIGFNLMQHGKIK